MKFRQSRCAVTGRGGESELIVGQVPVALSQDHNHLPLFFSMSVRKIKTPTKFERSGIFEPGADYRGVSSGHTMLQLAQFHEAGNESWIFIQFSDNKDFESKNLAALVEMFRKGSEGTIPKESLMYVIALLDGNIVLMLAQHE